MTGFADKQMLINTFVAARGRSVPTMRLGDMGGTPYTPVEAVFVDTRSDKPLGACWYSDMRDLLDFAEFEGDTEKNNPNLKVVNEAFREMTQMRHDLGQAIPSRRKLILTSRKPIPGITV